jgi:serpin B
MAPVNTTSQVDSVAFALELYRRVAKGDDPVLLSPVSISLALRPLSLGARGGTADGIRAALRGGVPHDDDPAVVSDDPDRFLEADGKTLSLAIGLWLDHRLEVDPVFGDVMKADRRVHWFDLDFAAAEAATARINGWTAERTKGRIRDLLERGAIDSTTRFMSTSAVHFQGKWAQPFEKELTMPFPFTRADGTQVPTDMMLSTMTTSFARVDGARLLALDYSNEYTFYAFLPDSPSGLARLESQLSRTTLSRWIDSLEEREVEIWLPRFRNEAKCDLDAALIDLGMADAFDSRRADFSGIGRSPEGLPLSLSGAVHQTFIDVNELETEAAAATAFAMVLGGPPPPKDQEKFHADHPFLYMIRNRLQGSILFIGRMTGH